MHPVLTYGRNYYFQVRARMSGSVRSPWSEQLYVPVVPTQFPPPPTHFALAMYYQKYMGVGGIHVVAPSEVPDQKMIQTREIISAMHSDRSEMVDAAADYDTRIHIQEGPYFILGAEGIAIKTSTGLVALVPVEDEDCGVLIHEFAHLIHFILEELAGGAEFVERVDGLYQAALTAGRWLDMYATTNAEHFWTETLKYWLWESMPHSLAASYPTLADYEPKAAKLIEEVLGDATVPAECKP